MRGRLRLRHFADFADGEEGLKSYRVQVAEWQVARLQLCHFLTLQPATLPLFNLPLATLPPATPQLTPNSAHRPAAKH